MQLRLYVVLGVMRLQLDEASERDSHVAQTHYVRGKRHMLSTKQLGPFRIYSGAFLVVRRTAFQPSKAGLDLMEWVV